MENIKRSIERESYGESCLGFVIRIISKTELIIDVGQDCLTVGDKIVVYEAGDELFDLSGNCLGVFEKVKAELTVVQTSDYYSICSDIERITSNALLPFEKSFIHTQTITHDLNIEESSVKPLKSKFTSKINVGDPVKKG